MVKAALRIMRFYAHESCGWCIPCREGTTWLRKILDRFHRGPGHAKRHPPDRRPGQEHAGPHLLPAGRCGGHAHDFDRGEVPARIRRASRRQAVPLRARESHGDGVMADLVKLTIDGREVQAAPGTLVIDAAKTVGHRDSGVLLLRGPFAGGRLPHVPGGSGKDAEDDDGMHASGGRRHGGADRDAAGEGGAQVHAGIPAHQPSAGLPGVRQGRRVRTAGHGVPLRRGRKPLHRDQDSHAGKAVFAGGVLRCAALHPVLPLRARLQ